MTTYNTLTRFGVPLPAGNGRGGMLQPKYKYRFRVRVFQFGPITGGVEFSLQVQSVSKPTLNQEPIPVHAYNSVAYYAGKHTWQEIQLTLKDDITNTVSRLVGHQVQKQLNHFEQTGYAAAQNYKFSMVIESMDGGNDGILETWYLEGCYLQSVNYGELDYQESNFQTIALTIRYDNATQYDGLMPRNPDRQPGNHL
jgi:hypothetical protein